MAQILEQTSISMQKKRYLFRIFQVSILYKSIAGRYRSVRVVLIALVGRLSLSVGWEYDHE